LGFETADLTAKKKTKMGRKLN
jgi:hypothetical protein